ncbi:MAG: DoxX family protein [Deltaproteobacteria bacterium]
MIKLYDDVAARLAALGPAWIPTLARLVFAGVLLMYFVNSGWGKIGTGLLSPDIGAFYQIFPKQVAAANGDLSTFGLFPRLIILAGTIGEILLPILIVVGLLTRLAALGMIGFVAIQTATDIWGHGTDATTIGAWFDTYSDSLIADQRAFWVLTLVTLVMMGAGPLSLDQIIRGRSTRV